LSYKVALATKQYGLQFKSSGTLPSEKFAEWVHEIEKEDAKLLKEFLDFGKAMLAKVLCCIKGDAQVQFCAMKKESLEE